MTNTAHIARLAELARLDKHCKRRIPIKILLHSTVHEGFLGDPAADVTIFLTLMFRRVTDQGPTIKRLELANPQSITGIV